MKRALIAAFVLVAGTALASAVSAQGRHDEKPHGSSKPSAESTAGKSQPIAGGRHDEKPHGPRNPAKKASAPQSPETNTSGK